MFLLTASINVPLCRGASLRYLSDNKKHRFKKVREGAAGAQSELEASPAPPEGVRLVSIRTVITIICICQMYLSTSSVCTHMVHHNRGSVIRWTPRTLHATKDQNKEDARNKTWPALDLPTPEDTPPPRFPRKLYYGHCMHEGKEYDTDQTQPVCPCDKCKYNVM